MRSNATSVGILSHAIYDEYQWIFSKTFLNKNLYIEQEELLFKVTDQT